MFYACESSVVERGSKSEQQLKELFSQAGKVINFKYVCCTLFQNSQIFEGTSFFSDSYMTEKENQGVWASANTATLKLQSLLSAT